MAKARKKARAERNARALAASMYSCDIMGGLSSDDCYTYDGKPSKHLDFEGKTSRKFTKYNDLFHGCLNDYRGYVNEYR